MSLQKVTVIRYVDGKASKADDVIVEEQPLEIILDGTPFQMTMRMPGEEIPLAVGLCFSEGIINSADDFMSINYCGEETGNRISLFLDPAGKSGGQRKERRFVTYSSCGICGKELVEDVLGTLPKVGHTLRITSSRITHLKDDVERRQEVFHATGGTHAAGIFNHAGECLAASEDIGRHNALDKAIGKVLLARKNKEASVVVVTSRVSYEMVQKACRLGAELLIGSSAPTSLAVELARDSGMTLVAFVREKRSTVYCHPERVEPGGLG